MADRCFGDFIEDFLDRVAVVDHLSGSRETGFLALDDHCSEFDEGILFDGSRLLLLADLIARLGFAVVATFGGCSPSTAIVPFDAGEDFEDLTSGCLSFELDEGLPVFPLRLLGVFDLSAEIAHFVLIPVGLELLLVIVEFVPPAGDYPVSRHWVAFLRGDALLVEGTLRTSALLLLRDFFGFAVIIGCQVHDVLRFEFFFGFFIIADVDASMSSSYWRSFEFGVVRIHF